MEHEIIDVDDFIPDVECTGADLDVEFIGQSQPSQQFPQQTPSAKFNFTSESNLKLLNNVCNFNIPMQRD
jgi:hypothetical protein